MEATGIHRSKIERILEKLSKIEQQIEQQTTSTNRLITVLNWHEYQENEQRFEQQPSNDRATTEQQVSTLQELKNIITIEKEKSKKENFCDESHEAQPDTKTPNPTPVAPPPSPAKSAKKTRQQPEELLFPFESEEFKRIWNIWMQQPKQKKKPASAHQLTLDKLSKYNEQFAIELIDKAAQGGYQGCIFSSTQSDYEAWLRNQGTGTVSSQRQQPVNQQTGNQKTFDYYDRIAKGAIQQLSGDLNTGDLND